MPRLPPNLGRTARRDALPRAAPDAELTEPAGHRRMSRRTSRSGPTCLRRALEWHGGERREGPTNHTQGTHLRVLRPRGARRGRGGTLAVRRCARLGRPGSTRTDRDRLRLVVARVGSFSPDAFEWLSFRGSSCLSPASGSSVCESSRRRRVQQSRGRTVYIARCGRRGRYLEPGANWTFDKSQVPSDGLASKPHLAVGGKGKGEPPATNRIARAHGV